jgi:hypothetical protein
MVTKNVTVLLGNGGLIARLKRLLLGKVLPGEYVKFLRWAHHGLGGESITLEVNE